MGTLIAKNDVPYQWVDLREHLQESTIKYRIMP
jgi:hypothetical protein